MSQDVEKSSLLRSVVVEAIRSNPETYSEAILGRPRKEYMTWIATPNAWGGAIELNILATHFQVEIHSYDVSTGRLDQFGGGLGYKARLLLVYSGIHFDVMALTPDLQAPMEYDLTQFPLDKEKESGSKLSLTNAAKELIQIWKQVGIGQRKCPRL